MSEAENGADGGAAAEAGLALLLGGGVAEAMATVEATLATVQGAAARLLGGLSRVQRVGAAAASVPPVPAQVQPPAAPAEAPVAPSLQVRPTERLAPSPASWPAGPERAATFAAVSAPGGDPTPVAPAAPMPAPLRPAPLAAQVPAPVQATAPIAAVLPRAEQPDERATTVASTAFAVFAPAVSSVPVSSPAPTEPAAAADAVTTWATAASEREPDPWVPQAAAPMPATTGRGAAASRGDAAAAGAAGAAGHGGPTGGDVFLDGTRVGTWIADHLAREAGRPQAGGTGFDPRLTPAWPGTLQGN